MRHVNSSHSGGAEGPDAGDTVQAPNRIAAERAERIRQAIKLAGGNNRVSERSGVPLSTLGHYLRGRDPQSEVLAAIADACGASIEWLITGRGSMTGAPLPVAAPQPRPEPPTLFSFVNMDMMATAIEGAIAAIATRGAPPEGRPLAQIACLLYDSAKQRLLETKSKE